MASEVTVARESGATTLNAEGGVRARRQRPISFNDGRGGTRKMDLSEDAEKNEVMQAISNKFTIPRGNGNAKVDDYVRRAEDGSYEVKVWQLTGQAWRSDKSYGQLINLRNNPDYTLRMRRQRGQWRGELHRRGNYGYGEYTENLIFRS